MLPPFLTDLARDLVRLVYPNACQICDAPEADGPALRHGLCATCLAAVTADARDTCPRCAATVGPHTDVSGGCPACRDHSFAFDQTVRLGVYEGVLRAAILRTKSLRGEALAELLGRVTLDQRGNELRELGLQVVVPVPLHWRRRFVRGYNQADALAREVATGLGVSFDPQCLRRVKSPVQHAQPSATARRENVRGAFRCRPRASHAGRTVLLVDDVMTTGSTVGEAARVLHDAGARVCVFVLARA